MHFHEQALSFSCRGQGLVGIVSLPEQAAARAVLIVVGGPQYRVGSHRQFTQLARGLAGQGSAVMRFDYRGMGDSEGEMRDFQDVDEDLGAAVDALLAAVPSAREVVIWGLCDAASAALFYAGRDPRVTGLVLLNPWARTTGGHARATLKHYYLARLRDPAFWKKIVSGGFNPVAAAGSMLALVKSALGGTAKPSAQLSAEPSAAQVQAAPAGPSLHERMQAGFAGFKGKVLLIISGADLTAREFLDMADGSRQWRRMLAEPRVTQRRIDAADHTFSRRLWKDQVTDWTGAWLRSW